MSHNYITSKRKHASRIIYWTTKERYQLECWTFSTKQFPASLFYLTSVCLHTNLHAKTFLSRQTYQLAEAHYCFPWLQRLFILNNFAYFYTPFFVDWVIYRITNHWSVCGIPSKERCKNRTPDSNMLLL